MKKEGFFGGNAAMGGGALDKNVGEIELEVEGCGCTWLNEEAVGFLE